VASSGYDPLDDACDADRTLGRSYRERWLDDDSIVHDADMVQSAYQACISRSSISSCRLLVHKPKP
jgi:hypothetical protein